MHIRSLLTGAFALAVVTAGASVTAPAADETVVMRQFFFDPAVVTISAGDTVTWNNSGVVPHTSTSGDPSGGAGALWNSGLISPTGSFSLTFDGTQGQADYFCTIHPTLMFGQVIVDGSGVVGTLIPASTSITGGQPVRLDAWLINFEASPQGVNVRLRVTSPLGGSRILVDRNVVLPAGARVQRTLSMTLPTGLPAGDYVVDVEIRDATGNLVSTDEDVYTKATEAAGSLAGLDQVTVEWTEGPHGNGSR